MNIISIDLEGRWIVKEQLQRYNTIRAGGACDPCPITRIRCGTIPIYYIWSWTPNSVFNAQECLNCNWCIWDHGRLMEVSLRLIGTFVNKQIWYLKTYITFIVLCSDMELGKKKKKEWETHRNWYDLHQVVMAFNKRQGFWVQG